MEATSPDYLALAEFRYQIRRFLHFSEQAARSKGIEPQHHQLLLSAKAVQNGEDATVSRLAELLQLQHHSAVELIDRVVRRGLVKRRRSPLDRRKVVVQLTAKGEKALRELSLHHQAELASAAPALIRSLQALVRGRSKPAKPERG